MQKHIRILIALLFLSLLFTSIKAQHFLSTNGKAIVNENQDTIMLRGMGLGGWMVQEGYMLQTASFANPQHKIREKIEELIGESDTDLFYEAWLANHVRKSDIDSLKSWGFNSVRLPMHYNLYTLPIEEEPIPGEQTWLTKGFDLTDSLISWCKQNEMYVILDLHAAPGGQGYDAGISDYDDTKPSLWESEENRDKMVALWKNLAERYADEQWIAGYDLLNEPNWDLPGGTALRNLYQEITDSIRTVDTQHILFIEGNWFANDFTGLTPPWDDNMVYSPHKYWSTNDEATMQWVIDLRNTYDIPLYLGESGENSNVWFRDAIRLMEDLEIGWAWWPMKKVESIAGPLSVEKTPEYQSLLDYWSGNGSTPTAEFAKATLMQLTEDLKTENCRYQKDVIDAMFRQVNSDETLPFNIQSIPGVVYSTDYDLGVIGKAYHDVQSANYLVSTGTYSAWNSGWTYRNDGVDIEACLDNTNSNGFNVGFLDAGEWMQYTVDVEASGVYDIHVRTASEGSGGQMRFSTGDADITPSINTPSTGGWQEWQTTIIPNVILEENDHKIKFHVDQSGFNVNSFEFVETGLDITSVATVFIAASTLDESNIKMNTNKFISDPLPPTPSDFEIFADGNSVSITNVSIDPNNARIINFVVDYTFSPTEVIKISYTGNAVNATDGTPLDNFTLEDVENTLAFVHPIPGRIQAEDYIFESGIVLENTTDEGGGQNIGYLDPGDYLDYEVNVTNAGVYNIEYRTAAEFGTGQLELQLIDDLGNVTILSDPIFTSTGGWQSWTSTNETVQIPAGRYTMRILIVQAPFNLNWLEFSLSTSTSDLASAISEVKIYPNPVEDQFFIEAELNDVQSSQLELYNSNGTQVFSKTIEPAFVIQEQLSLSEHPNGFYFLVIRLENGFTYSTKLIKVKD